MDQVEFRNKFIEQAIFENEKDVGVNTCNQLRLKYNYLELDLDYTSIYRKIVNYRIAKYGTSRLAEEYKFEQKIKLNNMKVDIDGNKEN